MDIKEAVSLSIKIKNLNQEKLKNLSNISISATTGDLVYMFPKGTKNVSILSKLEKEILEIKEYSKIHNMGISYCFETDATTPEEYLFYNKIILGSLTQKLSNFKHSSLEIDYFA